MPTILELAALIFIIYVIYRVINDQKKKETQNKNPHELLRDIYEKCDGPWDDVVITEEEYNRMKAIYGEKKIKK